LFEGNRFACACAAAVLAALAAPAVASAHPRSATVALDYRLSVDTQLPGVHAEVLDGDRALRLRLTSAAHVVVLGDLGEPMLRLGGGVWVNESSPTAQANRLITQTGRGWRRLAGGDSFAWHEHRLAPPPYDGGTTGPVARWTVPVVVDGHRTSLSGRFWRVARPRAWLWLAAVGVAAAAAAAIVRLRPQVGVPLTVAAGAVAGLAALVAETTFSLRDSPRGDVSWIPIGIGLVVAAVAGWLVLAGRGVRRAYVAGAIGAGVAALTLSWLGVFFHGVVVAALPPTPMRLACAAALGAGVTALLGALSIQEAR
jgi:hypothetical protein